MKTKILIVDDDPVMLKALEHCLSEAGYTVIAVKDGMEALNVFNTNKDLSLVISDIMMPNISGFTLLSAIRKFQDKYIPVILISALEKTKEISSALELQADDVIVKPIDFNVLLLKVNQVMNTNIYQ
jgi:DNA-binding response OmpR family regulator